MDTSACLFNRSKWEGEMQSPLYESARTCSPRDSRKEGPKLPG